MNKRLKVLITILLITLLSAVSVSAGEEAQNNGETAGVHPYAWLGLQDIPKCNYLDIYATYHFIRTYDSYAMSYVTEQTEAMEGVNSYKEDGSRRTYSVDGKILSVNDGSRNYMETDMSGMIEVSRTQLAEAMETGENIYGRSFVGTGSEAIPLYSENGDTAAYEYYEYNYPEAEAAGMPMTERFYMKDGDVFAVYQKTTMGDTDYEMLEVIKSISPDIPEGTFDFPDLSGYEEIKLSGD
ncbi:MAG: hypothetical protein IKE31_06110 [Eubacterium sp.]|nr:hypothetical protein [Eubacterium sp.]